MGNEPASDRMTTWLTTWAARDSTWWVWKKASVSRTASVAPVSLRITIRRDFWSPRHGTECLNRYWSEAPIFLYTVRITHV